MKFCKDCKHVRPAEGYRELNRFARCFAPQNTMRSPVTGEAVAVSSTREYCAMQRSANDGTHCGPEGAWFEPREEVKAAA